MGASQKFLQFFYGWKEVPLGISLTTYVDIPMILEVAKNSMQKDSKVVKNKVLVSEYIFTGFVSTGIQPSLQYLNSFQQYVNMCK